MIPLLNIFCNYTDSIGFVIYSNIIVFSCRSQNTYVPTKTQILLSILGNSLFSQLLLQHSIVWGYKYTMSMLRKCVLLAENCVQFPSPTQLLTTIVIPVPRDLAISPGFCGYQKHTCYMDKQAKNHTHNIKIKIF